MRAELLLEMQGRGRVVCVAQVFTRGSEAGKEEESLPSSKALRTQHELMQSTGCSSSLSLILVSFLRVGS